jgi:hypothetical protein
MDNALGRTPETQAILHLEETQAILGITQRELASLFGIEEDVLDEWIAHGAPASQYEDIERLHGLALLLDREILRAHIPKILRTPDAWLGNRTMLQVISIDGVAPIHEYLARLFAFRE